MKRLFITLIVLLALGTFAFLFSLNSIVAAAVETAGTRALGVETSLDQAQVGLVGANAQLKGLAIANPEGFGDGDFLSLGRVAFDLSVPSLFEEVITIPLIELEGTRLSVIQSGSASNVATILSTINANGKETDQGAESQDDSASKRFLIERIVLKEIEVQVQLDLLGDGSNPTAATLVIPEVLVEDIGSEGDGAPLSEVIGQVVEALLAATLDADGGNILDGTLRKTIEDGLGGLEDKGREAVERAREELEGTLGDIDESIDGAVDDTREKLERAAGDFLGGLGGKKD